MDDTFKIIIGINTSEEYEPKTLDMKHIEESFYDSLKINKSSFK